MTSRTESVRRILGILKKVSRVENWTPNKKSWLSLASGGLGQVSHEMGGRWKSQNRKNVYLSPYVEEPLNSKVIKGFVPELRSRYVFFEIRDSYYLCIYIWTVYVHFAYSCIQLWYTGNEPRSSGPLANTQLIRPIPRLLLDQAKL